MDISDYRAVLENFDNEISAIEKFQDEMISETDTRCKIIDPILFRILNWDQSRVVMEPKVESGYIDYFCSTEKNKFVLEAKRTGVSFKMPKGSGLFASRNLEKSCPELFAAIQQARSYAREKHCFFCVVSNGLNFAITHTHPLDNENDTIIISGKDQLRKHLHVVYEILSPYKGGFQYFTDHLEAKGNTRSPSQYNKVLVDQLYNKERRMNENYLAPVLRPYIETYFRDVDGDKDLLNEVYCDTDKLEGYSQEIRNYLRDRVPFFSSPVSELKVSGVSAGEFGQEYKLKYQQKSDGHVFLLLGNLGSGKTTFLSRFYNHILDEPTRKRLVWIHVDFIKYSKAQETIDEFTLRKINESLRNEYSHLQLGKVEALLEMYKEEDWLGVLC